MRVWTREIRVFPATRQFTNSKNIKHKIGPKTLVMYQCNNRMKNANYCKWLIVSEVDDRRQYMNYVFFFRTKMKNQNFMLHFAGKQIKCSVRLRSFDRVFSPHILTNAFINAGDSMHTTRFFFVHSTFSDFLWLKFPFVRTVARIA